MIEFFRSLRRSRADHRAVFNEFAVLMVFVIADHLAASRQRPRLRVVK